MVPSALPQALDKPSVAGCAGGGAVSGCVGGRQRVPDSLGEPERGAVGVVGGGELLLIAGHGVPGPGRRGPVADGCGGVDVPAVVDVLGLSGVHRLLGDRSSWLRPSARPQAGQRPSPARQEPSACIRRQADSPEALVLCVRGTGAPEVPCLSVGKGNAPPRTDGQVVTVPPSTVGCSSDGCANTHTGTIRTFG